MLKLLSLVATVVMAVVSPLAKIQVPLAVAKLAAAKFLGPVIGSIRYSILGEELRKAFQLAASGGFTVAGISAAIMFLAGDTSSVFTSSLTAGVVAYLLTHLVELIRRFNQGSAGQVVTRDNPVPTPITPAGLAPPVPPQ